ncbi:hypothetical protein EJ08DRAFT_657823 [Tothia fuscella]|uniref:Uncharacterized protein n=1 Tax=Tothia fuscella TaxID=1048955 RepID=A0A9P4NYN1_9PEZI|nr:hypothetical protein EJ08DRAFT_657823 [Tothia fuscella]
MNRRGYYDAANDRILHTHNEAIKNQRISEVSVLEQLSRAPNPHETGKWGYPHKSTNQEEIWMNARGQPYGQAYSNPGYQQGQRTHGHYLSQGQYGNQGQIGTQYGSGMYSSPNGSQGSLRSNGSASSLHSTHSQASHVSSTTSLYEYPVKQDFDGRKYFNYQVKKRDGEDPGPFRAVTNQNKRYKGIMCHQGNARSPNVGPFHLCKDEKWRLLDALCRRIYNLGAVGMRVGSFGGCANQELNFCDEKRDSRSFLEINSVAKLEQDLDSNTIGFRAAVQQKLVPQLAIE